MENINNVVLYAKNFYVHSGDIIKDMMIMVQEDHPEIKIKDTEHLYQVMLDDYRNWWETSRPNYGLLQNYEVPSVQWEDDTIKSTVYGILCRYSSYIKIYDSELKPPVYSERPGFQPQFRLSKINDIFNGPKPMDECNDIVNKFFNKTIEQRYQDQAVELRNLIKHDELTELSKNKKVKFSGYSQNVFNKMVVELSKKPEFPNKLCSVFKNGLELMYSPNRYLDFNVYPVYYEYEIGENEDVVECFKKSFAYFDKIMSGINFYYDCRGCHISSYAVDSFRKLYESLLKDFEKRNDFHVYTSMGYACIQIKPEERIIRFLFEDDSNLSEMSVVETSLININRVVSDPKH